jgi:hypothetical protein
MGDETTREEAPIRPSIASADLESESIASLATAEMETSARSRSNAVSEGPGRPRSNAMSEEGTRSRSNAVSEGPSRPRSNAMSEEGTRSRSNAVSEGPGRPRSNAVSEGPSRPRSNAMSEEGTRSRSNAVSEGPGRPRSNAMSEEGDNLLIAEVLEEEMGGVRAPSTEPSEKVTKNKGLITMAKYSGTVLGKKAIWDSFLPQMDKMGLATKVGDLTSAGISTGSSIGMKMDGTAEKTAQRVSDTGNKNAAADRAAGDIASSVGSSISLLFSTIKGITIMLQAHKGRDGIKALEGSKEFLKSIKSGFELANSIIKYTSGIANPGLVAAIPGLGITISACDIIINAYNVVNAHQAKVGMSEVSNQYKTALISILGDSPERVLPDLFHFEKRGQFGHRRKYLRLKPEKINELTAIASTPDYTELEIKELQRRYKLPEQTSFQDFYLAVKSYELGSKMEEINQKREVYGGRNITTSIISIAGDIASFFPLDGGITAGVLKGVSGGTQAAFAAGKFIQGKARDYGKLGGDTTRSTSSKYQEYVHHSRTIYMLLKEQGLQPDTPLKEINESKVDDLLGVEGMIKATGASTKVLYKTDYTNDASIRSQIDLLINGMKSGR